MDIGAAAEAVVQLVDGVLERPALDGEVAGGGDEDLDGARRGVGMGGYVNRGEGAGKENCEWRIAKSERRGGPLLTLARRAGKMPAPQGRRAEARERIPAEVGARKDSRTSRCPSLPLGL